MYNLDSGLKLQYTYTAEHDKNMRCVVSSSELLHQP